MEDLTKLLKQRRSQYAQEGLAKSLVCWNGKPANLTLYFASPPHAANITATIETEDGFIQDLPLKILSETKHSDHYQVKLRWDQNLPLGYHQLTILSSERSFKSLVICAPKKIETASEVSHSWGPFVALYALRTGNEWGIGSLKELKLAQQKCAEFGAQWLGTSPLFAVDLDLNPDSPLTRLFWNEIFLDVDDLVEKYAHDEALDLIQTTEFQKELADLRSTPQVDYHRVYQTKKRVLKILSQNFFAEDLQNQTAYRNFALDNPEIDAYARFRSDDQSEQNFHRFVQFEMNQALRELLENLPRGLYLDFPKDVNESGFDFHEFNPHTQQNEGYPYLRQSLRNHLKYCKILRMDQVMSLGFPKEDLFAIAMLEAYKAKADIVFTPLENVNGKQPEEIAKSKSKYLLLNLEDFWSEETPQNIPGAGNKHSLPISQWTEHKQAKSILEILKKECSKKSRTRPRIDIQM